MRLLSSFVGHFSTILFLTASSIIIHVQSHELRQTTPLNGRQLHCCAMLQYPNLFPSTFKTRGLDGMAVTYLEDMESIVNFTCTVLEVMTVKFTAFILEMEECYKNQNFTSPICKCELGVGGWMLKQQRLGRVQYISPFVRDDMKVVTHVDNTYSSTDEPFFVTTFTPTVWLAIAGLMVYWSLIKLLDKRFVPRDSSFKPMPREVNWYRRTKYTMLKSNLGRRLRKSVQSTVGRMIGHVDEGVEIVLPSTRQWSLNFIILLCGLFFVLIYETTMTHHRDCHKGKKATLVESYEGAVDLVGNKSCTYLSVDGSIARYATNVKYCRTVVSTGDHVYPASNSFVVPLGSDLYGPLANGTLRLLEGGILESLEDYFERRGECNLPESTIITSEKLRIFFFSAYVFTAVIFLAMVVGPHQVEPLGSEVSAESGQGNSNGGARMEENLDDMGKFDEKG